MHMLSKTTGNPSKIEEPHNAGNGQWRSANERGRAQENVHDLNLFATVQLPFARKEIRTISGFLELIGRFEFDFRRRGFFLERFEFLVCSMFNHMQRDCACACAVACLHPHNSISNVAVSLTFHDDYFFFF